MCCSFCLAPCCVYPFISWWTSGLFPILNDYKHSCCNICVEVCKDMCFQCFCIIPRNGMDGSYGTCLIFKETVELLSKVVVSFYRSQQLWNRMRHSLSLLPLGRVSLFCFVLHFNCSNRYVVVFHYGFHLHFPND